jgi:HlyD family secretion protein
MRWVRRIFVVVVVLAAALLIVRGLWPKPVIVDVARVGRGPFRVTVDEDGRTRVKDRHLVAAPLSGHLARLELHPGDHVEAGAVLARIVPLEPPLIDARTRAELESRLGGARAAHKQAEASVARSEAASEQAERARARVAALLERGAAAPGDLERAELAARTRAKELESARFGVRAADHEVAMAEAMLSRAQGSAQAARDEFVIRSPLAGRVLKVMRESEGPVAAGQSLVELGDPQALEIVVDVLTSDAVGIRPGAKVVLRGWGGEAPLAGRARLVEPSAFSRVSALSVEEQRVNVIVDPEGPPALRAELGDGWRVEAEISVWETASAISVPASAEFRDDVGWAVFVVRAGRAHQVQVGLGRRGRLALEVTEGLGEGDVVILHPSDRVRDGEAVSAGSS